MSNPRSPQNALAALAAKLSARGLTIELRADGLRVTNENTSSQTADTRKSSDKITIRVGEDGRHRFFTSWGQALAPVDQTGEAAEKVLTNLAGPVLGRQR
ncbi:hypothetical protein ACFQ07_28410 [Actinomadura adrarensis]|uniref:TldD/PmbA family protein n=1 Tax=Actinomadura adrarensis TaxID=1819600 RepID=A0ABW3CPK7_9ACTN